MIRSRSNFFNPISLAGVSKDAKVLVPLARPVDKDFYQYLIESKMTKKEEHRVRTILFGAIGLCLSLSIVITAFEWKFHDYNDLVNLGSLSAEFEEMLEIPITEQPPPPPPKAQIATIVEVRDEVEILEEIDIDLDVEITEESAIEDVIYDELAGVEEEEVDEIFQFVEQQPYPHGGMKAFYKYVGENITYPAVARRAMIEGKVYVRFVINKDGSISDIEILKGIGFGCDMEAKRVLALSPKWVPGKQRGRPVKVRMALPMIFILE